MSFMRMCAIFLIFFVWFGRGSCSLSRFWTKGQIFESCQDEKPMLYTFYFADLLTYRWELLLVNIFNMMVNLKRVLVLLNHIRERKKERKKERRICKLRATEKEKKNPKWYSVRRLLNYRKLLCEGKKEESKRPKGYGKKNQKYIRIYTCQGFLFFLETK